MTRLEPFAKERFVPICETTRRRAYLVSPTFARLRPFLEGPSGDSTATHPAHLYLNERQPGTREFFVSNFEFVLRDAAFQAGARSAREAEELFDRIGHELESAIATRKIAAGGRGPALLAAPMPGDYGRILGQTLVSLSKLYTLDGMVFPEDGTSSSTVEDLQRLENLTQTASAPTSELKALDPQRSAKRLAEPPMAP